MCDSEQRKAGHTGQRLMPASPDTSSPSNDVDTVSPAASDSRPAIPASGSALGLSFAPEDSPAPAPAVAQAPDASVPEPSLVPADQQPTTPRLAKQAHFSDLTQIRTISPVPQRRQSYRAPSAPAPAEPAPAPPRDPPPRRPSLTQTHSDLRALLKSFLLLVPPTLRRLRFLVPSPLRVIARFVVRYVAMFLHARGALGSNLVYDVVAHMWRVVITIFFREIRSRGAWKIPRSSEGAVIFVVGPHHNQVRTCSLALNLAHNHCLKPGSPKSSLCTVPRPPAADERGQARERTADQLPGGRKEHGQGVRRSGVAINAEQCVGRVGPCKTAERSLLTTDTSIRTVPVARAQDYAFAGQGTISLSPSDPLTIIGNGTNFTKDFSKPRSQVLLPRNLGSSTAEVVEVVSDTELKLKKEFSKKALEALKEREGGVAFKVRCADGSHGR